MDASLELAVYRNLLGSFPRHCRLNVDGSIIEVSERNLGWNDAHSSLFARKRAFEDFLTGLPVGSREYLTPLLVEGLVSLVYRKDGSIGLEADCSDFFFWGCSDAEDIELSDLPEIWPFYDRDQSLDFWIARKRQMQPQAPVKEMMISDGRWTPEWEALPKNPIDGVEEGEPNAVL
jgi:hypothetical protein